MSQATPYPQVNELLERLLTDVQIILRGKLVGLYLYGSLVTGDFDSISDVDLLAAVTSEVNEAEFATLQAMHERIVMNNPEWEERIEIAYYSLEGLKRFKTKDSPLAIISPGEPFNVKQAGKEWLMNWYMVQVKGQTLFGPPPQTIIEPTTQGEFLQAVKAHITGWRDYFQDVHSRAGQAYAILTMCRGLYTSIHGEQVSKKKAAQWAAKELPEWSGLIENALVWRQAWRETGVDHAATLDETRRFVYFMIERVEHLKT